MIYSVNYDLKSPGQDYKALHEAIKSCGVWWHYLGSTWLVDTNLDASGVYEKISPYIDGNDWVLVIAVTSDYEGWLPKKAWDWIKSRTTRMAA